MKITQETINPTKLTVTIAADEKDLAPLKQHVLRHFTTSVKVPGFRPGKAPLHLLEKNINQQAFIDEFLEHAINDLYRKAIAEEDLRPIGSPEIQVSKFVPYSLLEFKAEQEVVGKIKLPNYKIIKLAPPKVEATADDVAEIIKKMQEKLATKAKVERVVKDGDEAVIDFKGTDNDGKDIVGAESKGYALTIGSKTFIPGFEEQLIGLKAGDKKDFMITFPADYQAEELQNKEVNFKVTVNEVNELVKPKVDDAFATQVGPFTTVSELKADIKKQIKVEKQWQADRDYESQLIRKIADKAEVPVPETLIMDQVKRSEDEEKRNLMYKGVTWEEHLKQENITENQHRERNKPDAIERVKASLVLSEISELEKVEITPAELEARITELKKQYKDEQMQTELDKPENRQDIAARILTEKTLEKLRAYASK